MVEKKCYGAKSGYLRKKFRSKGNNLKKIFFCCKMIEMEQILPKIVFLLKMSYIKLNCIAGVL